MDRARRRSEAWQARLRSTPSASKSPPHTPYRVRGTFSSEALSTALREAKGRHARHLKLEPLRIALAVLAGLGLFVGVIAGVIWLQTFWAFFLAPFVLLGIIAVAAIRKTAREAPSYDGQRAAALERLLEALEPELDPRAELHVDLDFGGYDRTRGEAQGRSWLGVPKVVLFRRTWLQASFRSREGATVALRATVVAKRKQRITSSWFKKRDSVKDVLRVSVRPKGGPPPEDAAKRAAAFAAGIDGLKLRGARVRPRALELVFATDRLRRFTRQGTWSVERGGALLNGHRMLAAVAATYRLAVPGPNEYDHARESLVE